MPDDYDYYFAELERAGLLDMREEAFGDYTGFICITRNKPDLTIFEQSELDSLVEVNKFFKDFGSARIMAFSHEETGYVSTKEGEPISYLYARNLRI